jgi:hypothetical protein
VQLHSFFDVQLDGLNIQLSAVSALTLGYHWTGSLYRESKYWSFRQSILVVYRSKNKTK